LDLLIYFVFLILNPNSPTTKQQGTLMSAQVFHLREATAREIKEVPKEYLPNLLQIVIVFRESVALKPAEASFRQGLKEALAGETRLVSELWDGIDAE
jgi:hypothetical protein